MRSATIFVWIMLIVFAASACKSTPEPAPEKTKPQVSEKERQAEEAKLKFASMLERIKSHAVALHESFQGQRATLFLDAVQNMDEIGSRTIYTLPGALQNPFGYSEKAFYTEEEYGALTPAEQAKLERHEVDVEFYYSTKYGDMLSYALVLNALDRHGVGSVAQDNKLVDFGFGYIGHLRGLAMMGLNVVGIDVDPLLATLYSQEGDTGVIAGRGIEGNLELAIGYFPKDPKVNENVGQNIDVFMSKNVLKAEYIKPPDGSKPEIDLGVTDAEFLNAVSSRLARDGVMIVYNTCDRIKANCFFPFSAEAISQAGFKSIVVDQEDTSDALRLWYVLGRDKEKGINIGQLKAYYTILKKK